MICLCKSYIISVLLLHFKFFNVKNELSKKISQILLKKIKKNLLFKTI
jgi:hypothetical protein